MFAYPNIGSSSISPIIPNRGILLYDSRNKIYQSVYKSLYSGCKTVYIYTVVQFLYHQNNEDHKKKENGDSGEMFTVLTSQMISARIQHTLFRRPKKACIMSIYQNAIQMASSHLLCAVSKTNSKLGRCWSAIRVS